jgi:hypothetical protein
LRETVDGDGDVVIVAVVAVKRTAKAVVRMENFIFGCPFFGGMLGEVVGFGKLLE